MHLVEPEEVGPIEGDDPRVTPPRPPHRRVSVSLLFTLSVLIGLVVTIYLVLPARHGALLTDAISQHRATDPAWDLESPTAAELRAWAIGVVGKEAPLPKPPASVTAARRVKVLNRDAALMRVQIGGEQVTYLVQRNHGVAAKENDKHDGELRALAWRRDKFTCIGVGPTQSSTAWLEALQKK